MDFYGFWVFKEPKNAILPAPCSAVITRERREGGRCSTDPRDRAGHCRRREWRHGWRHGLAGAATPTRRLQPLQHGSQCRWSAPAIINLLTRKTAFDRVQVRPTDDLFGRRLTRDGPHMHSHLAACGEHSFEEEAQQQPQLVKSEAFFFAFLVKGLLVQEIEWKQTDGGTTQSTN